jgi:hypothetical protein
MADPVVTESDDPDGNTTTITTRTDSAGNVFWTTVLTAPDGTELVRSTSSSITDPATGDTTVKSETIDVATGVKTISRTVADANGVQKLDSTNTVTPDGREHETGTETHNGVDTDYTIDRVKNADGSSSFTRTDQSSDGSSSRAAGSRDADGNSSVTYTNENPDGSETLITRTTDRDGNGIEKRTRIDADGSAEDEPDRPIVHGVTQESPDSGPEEPEPDPDDLGPFPGPDEPDPFPEPEPFPDPGEFPEPEPDPFPGPFDPGPVDPEPFPGTGDPEPDPHPGPDPEPGGEFPEPEPGGDPEPGFDPFHPGIPQTKPEPDE